MPFLEQHGGMYGGGKPGKMVKVIASLTEPASPSKYTIWLVTDSYNEVDFLYQTESATAVNDIKITKSELTPTLKGTIEAAAKTITHTATADSRPKLFETEYFDLYATLGSVLKKLSTTQQTLKAFWYDGTKWVQFSFDATEIVGFTGKYLFAYNYITGEVRNSNIDMLDESAQIDFITVDTDEKFIYAYIGYNKRFIKLDYSLTPIETYNWSTGMSGNGSIVVESKKWVVSIGGTYIYFYDYRTGQQIKTYQWSSYMGGYYFITYDKVRDRFIFSYYGNGSVGGILTLNPSTWSAGYLQSGCWGVGLNYSPDGKYIYLFYEDSDGYGYVRKIDRLNDSVTIYTKSIGRISGGGGIFADDPYVYLTGYQPGSSSTANVAFRKYLDSSNFQDDYIWSVQTSSYFYTQIDSTGYKKPNAITHLGTSYMLGGTSQSSALGFYVKDATTDKYMTAASLNLASIRESIFALQGLNLPH
jgi:hypothetical protein